MTFLPVSLPPFTNREDFLLPVSLFDDDTGDAINLAGITLATPGTPFTAAAWDVTDGAIATTSATSLTIPDYPIGDELSAVSLTIGTGLAIKAGDPILIADSATGLNTMLGTVTSYASATGKLVCQIGTTFQFEIRRGPPRETGAGYVTWYDFGVQNDAGPLLSASLGNGVMITDLGFLQIRIAESDFRKLCAAGTYRAALTMFDGTDTRQVFIAALPVFSGGVTN